MLTGAIDKIRNLAGEVPREARLFLLKGIVLLLGWNLLYSFVLEPHHLIDPLLTKITGAGTYALTRQLFAGHWVRMVPGINQLGFGEAIQLDHQPTIIIFSGCNGLELFVLYAGFICCIPISFKRMVIFIFSGVALIYVLNVIRCTALVYLKYHHFKSFDIAHHYIFQYTVYLIIFLIWERYFKTLKASHEPAEA